MREHRTPPTNGHPNWQPPSPWDLLIEIKGQLGGLETGQEMTLDEMRSGFGRIERKADHAHARTTELKGRVDSLERLSRTAIPPRTERAASLLSIPGLKALSAALPELREVLLAAVALLAALGWARNLPTGSPTSPSAPAATVSPSAP